MSPQKYVPCCECKYQIAYTCEGEQEVRCHGCARKYHGPIESTVEISDEVEAWDSAYLTAMEALYKDEMRKSAKDISEGAAAAADAFILRRRVFMTGKK